MNDEPASHLATRPSLLELARERLMRAVALLCLLFGILYWARLVGVYDHTMWRFDLMPIYWRVPATALAVLFPFAAVGLWLLAPWGPVVWFLCAAIETVMYVGFPAYYGERPLVIVLHFLVAVLYGAIRLALYLKGRRAT